MRNPGFWLLLGFGVFGCTSDTTPTVYVGTAYQVRCIDCQPRAQDDAVRSIKAVEGEAGHRLACRIDNESGTKRATFSVVHDSADEAKNYALELNDANLSEESDGPCEVRVVDGANTYKGACGSDEPTEDRPCQVSVRLEGRVLKGNIYCAKIPSDATANITRYVVAPLTRDPAQFEIYGCSGL